MGGPGGTAELGFCWLEPERQGHYVSTVTISCKKSQMLAVNPKSEMRILSFNPLKTIGSMNSTLS